MAWQQTVQNELSASQWQETRNQLVNPKSAAAYDLLYAFSVILILYRYLIMNNDTLAICGTVLGACPSSVSSFLRQQLFVDGLWVHHEWLLLAFTIRNRWSYKHTLKASCAGLIIPLKIYETIMVSINMNGAKCKRPPLPQNFNAILYFPLVDYTEYSATGGRLNEWRGHHPFNKSTS